MEGCRGAGVKIRVFGKSGQCRGGGVGGAGLDKGIFVGF